MGLSPTLMLQRTKVYVGLVPTRRALTSRTSTCKHRIRAGHVELSGPDKQEQLGWRRSSFEGSIHVDEEQLWSVRRHLCVAEQVSQMSGALWSQLSIFSRPEASAGRRVGVRAMQRVRQGGMGARAAGRPCASSLSFKGVMQADRSA